MHSDVPEMEFKIPPLPTTLGEILQVLSRETPVPDNDRLVAIIQKDPAISLYVLRQVNSAYYGLRRHITEIHRAVTLLGLKRISNLVLAAALKQTFAYLADTTAQNIYKHVIKTSVATAAFARDLTAHLHLPLAETAFTAGLLHQLGRLVFLYSVPHLYVSLWQNSNTPASHCPPHPPSLETEYARFNTDYLRLGASTLREWELPEEFVAITKGLHALGPLPTEPLRSLTLAVDAGRAASETFFLPVAAETDPGPVVSAPLAVLAETQRVEAEKLAVFLADRSEVVYQFAQSVMTDG